MLGVLNETDLDIPTHTSQRPNEPANPDTDAALQPLAPRSPGPCTGVGQEDSISPALRPMEEFGGEGCFATWIDPVTRNLGVLSCMQPYFICYWPVRPWPKHPLGAQRLAWSKQITWSDRVTSFWWRSSVKPS